MIIIHQTKYYMFYWVLTSIYDKIKKPIIQKAKDKVIKYIYKKIFGE